MSKGETQWSWSPLMWALTFILASVHRKLDEPWTIRHNVPFDTLWTEEPSNSLCTAAKHSGTFGCRRLEDEEFRPRMSEKKHLFLIWPASLNDWSGYSHFSSYRISTVLLCFKWWRIVDPTKAQSCAGKKSSNDGGHVENCCWLEGRFCIDDI